MALGVLQQHELDEEQPLEYDFLFRGNKWHLLHQYGCKHNICYFQCLVLDVQDGDPVTELLLKHVLEEDVGPLEVELEMDDNNRTLQLVLEHDDMLRLALLYLAVQRVIHATRELVTHYNVHDCMDF